MRRRLDFLDRADHPTAVRFRSWVTMVDLVIIAFFISGPLLQEKRYFLWLDYSLAALLALDFAARGLAAPSLMVWARPQDEVDRFEDRRLPSVVVDHEDSVLRKRQLGRADATKVLNGDSGYFQRILHRARSQSGLTSMPVGRWTEREVGRRNN